RQRASGHAGTAPPACSAAAPGPPAGIAVGAAVGGAAGGDAERRRAGDTGSAAAASVALTLALVALGRAGACRAAAPFAPADRAYRLSHQRGIRRQRAATGAAAAGEAAHGRGDGDRGRA